MRSVGVVAAGSVFAIGSRRRNEVGRVDRPIKPA
jgi:hypothetical protein